MVRGEYNSSRTIIQILLFLQCGCILHPHLTLKGIKIMKLRLLAIAVFVFALTGCATPAPLDFTVDTVETASVRKDANLRSLTVGYAPQSQQGVVQTDHQVPPMWKEALTDALNRSLVFRDNSDTSVNLSVRISRVELKSFGLDITVHTTALYEVIDRENGDQLFSELIRSSALVPVSYAFNGQTRTVEAFNRAVRANIENFMKTFSNTDFNRI